MSGILRRRRLWAGLVAVSLIAAAAFTVGMLATEGDAPPAPGLHTERVQPLVDGNLPAVEIPTLRDSALADARISDLVTSSSRFELLTANVLPPDPKRHFCPQDSCAELSFYDWANSRAVVVVLDRATAALVTDPRTEPRIALTQHLREHAAQIALADPAVRSVVGPDSSVSNVADVIGPGRCATNLCAVVALTVSPDGSAFGQHEGVGVQVDLHAEEVVYLALGSRTVIDRR